MSAHTYLEELADRCSVYPCFNLDCKRMVAVNGGLCAECDEAVDAAFRQYQDSSGVLRSAAPVIEDQRPFGSCPNCGCELENPAELTHECPPGFLPLINSRCDTPEEWPDNPFRKLIDELTGIRRYLDRNAEVEALHG